MIYIYIYVYLFSLLHLETNVVFSLLNGEAFDYIGSSRMVYDLKQNNFNALGTNLKFDDIQSVIEFGQLGKGEIFLHTNGKDDTINRLQRALNASFVNDSVPPTSVQSFLEVKSNLPTVVISNHERQFKNRYYNGILDDAESLDFDKYIHNLLNICILHIFTLFDLILLRFVYHVLETILARLHQI